MLPTTCILLLASKVTLALEQRQSGRFTLYDLPTPLSGVCDLARGPDNAIWAEDFLVNKIVRLDPKTGNIEEIDIPFTTPLSNVTIPNVLPIVQDRLATGCAIRPGADGNIWATYGLRNQLLRVDVKTKAIKVFEVTPLNPAGNLFPLNDLWSAKTGIWLTETTGNVIHFFSFRTETFTTYPIPTPASLPVGVFVASNSLVYFTEFIGNKIFTFNPASKELLEYPLPEPLQGPAVVRAEYGGYVYFGLFLGGGLGRINMQTNKIELFHSKLESLDSVLVLDDRAAIWIASFSYNVLTRFDIKTETFSYVPLPGEFTNGNLPGLPPYIDVSVDFGPGRNIWFGGMTRNVLGKYALP